MAGLKALAQGFAAGFGQTFAQQYPYQQQRKEEKRRYETQQGQLTAQRQEEQSRYETQQSQYESAIQREAAARVMQAIQNAQEPEDLASIPGMEGYDPDKHAAILQQKKRLLETKQMQAQAEVGQVKDEARQAKAEARVEQERQMQIRFAQMNAASNRPEQKRSAANIYRSLAAGKDDMFAQQASLLEAEANRIEKDAQIQDILSWATSGDADQRAAAIIKAKELDQEWVSQLIEKLPSGPGYDTTYAREYGIQFNDFLDQLWQQHAAQDPAKAAETFNMDQAIERADAYTRQYMQRIGYVPQVGGQTVDPGDINWVNAVLANPKTKSIVEKLGKNVDTKIASGVDPQEVMDELAALSYISAELKNLAVQRFSPIFFERVPNAQELLTQALSAVPIDRVGAAGPDEGGETEPRQPEQRLPFLNPPGRKEWNPPPVEKLVPPLVKEAGRQISRAFTSPQRSAESIEQTIRDYERDYESRGKPLQTLGAMLAALALPSERKKKVLQLLEATEKTPLNDLDRSLIANAIANSR